MPRHYMQTDLEVVNVEEFGAVGDGTTDDTESFNLAIQKIEENGGGTLHVPMGTYLLRDAVHLTDNLKITSSGATLMKDGTSNSYYVFLALSKRGKGYGAGASNVIIEGLTIKGSFSAKRGASITLHHSENVHIRNCIFREAVVSGHPIDLGGCSEVLISECSFEGFTPQPNRRYVEAIQIDHSTAEGNGGIDHPDSYDGLACRNVTVQNCKFVPLTIEGDTYPAPNPLGSHSRVDGFVFENIKFINNYVEGGVDVGSLVEPYSYADGWLHFYHIHGLEILGNTFINTTGNNARLLALYTLDTAIGLDELDNPNPPKVAYTPMPPKNVIFSRNTVIGFKHIDNARVIFLQGREVNSQRYYTENIKITNNKFDSCYSVESTSASGYNISADLVNANLASSVEIQGNHCTSIRRLLYATKSKKIAVRENDIVNGYYVPVSVDESEDVIVDNNQIDNYGGGIYMRNVTRASVKGNTLKDENSAVKSSYPQAIAMNTVNRGVIKDNNITASSGTELNYGINVYGTSNTGMVKDNIVTGFPTNVRIGPDTVGYTTS